MLIEAKKSHGFRIFNIYGEGKKAPRGAKIRYKKTKVF